MEYLCIDYGTKRIGLAYANDVLSLAVPLDALPQSAECECLQKIVEIAKKRNIRKIIVGYPLNMDGTTSKISELVDGFIVNLQVLTDIEIIKHDERLTSFDAENFFIKFKKTKKQTLKSRKSGEIDSRAATIILQDFIDEQHLKFDTK